jgi:hypothetical protein
MSTQMRKIVSFENDTLKVEHVQKTFKNLNSFEMTLKMLKTMPTYQEHIFWGFLCFLLFFWIFENMGSKIGEQQSLYFLFMKQYSFGGGFHFQYSFGGGFHFQ